jgi:prepilin-type N-terminal cleavage/methylation domain-containing protein
MKTNRFTVKKQKGFTLLELAFVLVVVAIITIPIYNRFTENRDKAATKEEVDSWLSIAGTAQEKYTNATDYTGTSETVMKNNNIFPDAMLVGAIVQNKAKGAVTCAPVNLTGTNDGLECTSTNYPKAWCTSLGQKVDKVMRRITVGATVIKPTDGVVDLTALGTACVVGANTIKFAIPK